MRLQAAGFGSVEPLGRPGDSRPDLCHVTPPAAYMLLTTASRSVESLYDPDTGNEPVCPLQQDKLRTYYPVANEQ